MNGDFSCGIGAISSNINDILKLEDYYKKLTDNLSNLTVDTVGIQTLVDKSIGEITSLGNVVAALRSNAD